jgi:hypothetical protein
LHFHFFSVPKEKLFMCLINTILSGPHNGWSGVFDEKEFLYLPGTKLQPYSPKTRRKRM